MYFVDDIFWNQVSDHQTQKAVDCIGTSIFIARYKNLKGHILVCT